MTKDYDKRLYGHRRYLNSINLRKPSVSYIDLDNEENLKYFNELLDSKKMDFNATYEDSYTHQDVIYFEYAS